jgi:hypothetical protein
VVLLIRRLCIGENWLAHPVGRRWTVRKLVLSHWQRYMSKGFGRELMRTSAVRSPWLWLTGNFSGAESGRGLLRANGAKARNENTCSFMHFKVCYIHYRTLDVLLRFKCSPASQKLSPSLTMENAEATAWLSQFIGKNLRIHTSDDRVFGGQMKCTDKVCCWLYVLSVELPTNERLNFS